MKKNQSENEKQLFEAMSLAHKQEYAELDGEINERLDNIRQRAVERISTAPAFNNTRLASKLQKTVRHLHNVFSPVRMAGGVTAVLMVAVYFTSGLGGYRSNVGMTDIAVVEAVDEILLYEMVFDEIPVDFYQQLAFVEWLDEEGHLLQVES